MQSLALTAEGILTTSQAMTCSSRSCVSWILPISIRSLSKASKRCFSAFSTCRHD